MVWEFDHWSYYVQSSIDTDASSVKQPRRMLWDGKSRLLGTYSNSSCLVLACFVIFHHFSSNIWCFFVLMILGTLSRLCASQTKQSVHWNAEGQTIWPSPNVAFKLLQLTIRYQKLRLQWSFWNIWNVQTRALFFLQVYIRLQWTFR